MPHFGARQLQSPICDCSGESPQRPLLPDHLSASEPIVPIAYSSSPCPQERRRLRRRTAWQSHLRNGTGGVELGSTARRADRTDHLASPIRRSVVDSVALRGKATSTNIRRSRTWMYELTHIRQNHADVPSIPRTCRPPLYPHQYRYSNVL